jgi:hypothetical protein
MKFSTAILFIACALFSVALAEDDAAKVTLVLENKSGLPCDIFWRYEGGEKLLKHLEINEKYAEETWAEQKVNVIDSFSHELCTDCLSCYVVRCEIRWQSWRRYHDQ